jgi:hypothetical protein
LPYKFATNASQSAPRLAPSSEQRSDPRGRPTQVEALIALRAYELYLGRGCDPGGALDDWLRAEQELMQPRIHNLPM